MQDNTLKGLFHATLAAAAVYEMTTASTKLRKLLLGACTGWHVVAVWQHLVEERKEHARLRW